MVLFFHILAAVLILYVLVGAMYATYQHFRMDRWCYEDSLNHLRADLKIIKPRWLLQIAFLIAFTLLWVIPAAIWARRKYDFFSWWIATRPAVNRIQALITVHTK